jgi:dephospho-CoA kinase
MTLSLPVGRAVLDRDGALDRRKLASIVFANADARRDLEHIIHPAVRTAIDAWFESLGQDVRFAIADIPLLYETGRDRDFDAVIVTACDPDTQLRRVIARDGVTEADARARIRAQLPMDEKVTRANYVIRTDGTFEETNAQVRAVHAALAG